MSSFAWKGRNPRGELVEGVIDAPDDAAVADHPGIAYGCVVTGVPPPHEELHLSELLDPEYVALRALFRLLHGLTGRPHRQHNAPPTTTASMRMRRTG